MTSTLEYVTVEHNPVTIIIDNADGHVVDVIRDDHDVRMVTRGSYLTNNNTVICRRTLQQWTSDKPILSIIEDHEINQVFILYYDGSLELTIPKGVYIDDERIDCQRKMQIYPSEIVGITSPKVIIDNEDDCVMGFFCYGYTSKKLTRIVVYNGVPQIETPTIFNHGRIVKCWLHDRYLLVKNHKNNIWYVSVSDDGAILSSFRKWKISLIIQDIIDLQSYRSSTRFDKVILTTEGEVYHLVNFDRLSREPELCKINVDRSITEVTSVDANLFMLTMNNDLILYDCINRRIVSTIYTGSVVVPEVLRLINNDDNRECKRFATTKSSVTT